MHEEKWALNTPGVVGGLMIVVGMVALSCQLLHVEIGRVIWPFYIIVPGVLIFLFALTVQSGGEPAAIVASIITMIGVILLYQSVTRHWESWAYAWTLIAPTSIGLGQMLYGKLKGHAGMVRSGKAVARTGTVMFVVGFIFFELILGISGFRIGSVGFPVLLIGLGFALLIRNIAGYRAQ